MLYHQIKIQKVKYKKINSYKINNNFKENQIDQ